MTARTRSTGREVVRSLALWLGVAVAIALVVVLAGWRPRVEYVVALAVVGAVATVALRRLGATMIEAMWPSPFPPKAVAPGIDHRITSLATLLRRSAEDPALYERRLRPLLEELAAHRLRRNHGIELATDPEAARRLLGDETWELVTQPADRRAVPSRLGRAITAIEQL
ncbi:MAG: hypothetical protein ABW195_09820 [Ilumatobacteraceae bacterium]